MKLLLAALLFSVSPIAMAKDCVPQSEMQVIASNFPQFKDLAGSEYCYDGSQISHLVAGIMFMRKTQFSPMEKSRDDLFSGRFASDWYQYFIGRINEFEIDENCPKGVAAYVYAFGGRTMYVCTMMLSDNYTALDRASVFMHEARHIDGYPHITCRTGPRAGLSGACDNRISDGGSYAVTVETYAQLSRYAIGIHPALKAYARSAAVVYSDEAFESRVQVSRSNRFLVMGNDRAFYAVDASGAKRLGDSPLLGKVVMRGQHMILFPEDKTQEARFVFARNEGPIAQAAGNQAVEYNQMSVADRTNVVGVHIGAQWNAIVSKNKAKLACDPRANTFQEVQFTDRPIAIIYPTGYDRAAKSVNLTLESGKVATLGCNGSTPFLQDSNISYDRKFKSLYKVGDLTLGVSVDGDLLEVTSKGSRPYALPGLDGKAFDLVPNQAVDFFGEN